MKPLTVDRSAYYLLAKILQVDNGTERITGIMVLISLCVCCPLPLKLAVSFEGYQRGIYTKYPDILATRVCLLSVLNDYVQEMV